VVSEGAHHAPAGDRPRDPWCQLVALAGLARGHLAALDYLEQQGGGDLAKGRELLVANAELNASCMRSAAAAMGLELFSASPGAAVTALKAPAGIASSDLVKGFKQQFAGVIADGQGEMKGQILRVAHIGYLDYLDCVGVIAGLEQVLLRLAPGKFVLGDGLRAAQQVYAEVCAAGEKTGEQK